MRLQLRLILETVVLTLLIWTYADQASYETCSAQVAVRVATSPEMVARIDDGRGGTADVVYISLKLQGPKLAVRKLEMESGTGAARFNLNLPLPTDSGQHGPITRDIREAVEQLPDIRDRGLQVEELSTSVITFTLDRYKSFTLTVDTDAGKFSDALDGKPLIEPGTVEVRVLESDLAKQPLPEQRRVISIEDQIRSRSEELSLRFNVPLGSKWGGMDAKYVPDQVRVTVRLAKSYQTVELTLIPLNVIMPAAMAGTDFDVEWQAQADLVQNISVRIPVGKAQSLDSKDVLAFIQIEKSDLPGELAPAATTLPAPTEGWIQREVQFKFPQNFGDVQVDGVRLVKFRIKAKADVGAIVPRGDVP